jgi:hypothetical protein
MFRTPPPCASHGCELFGGTNLTAYLRKRAEPGGRARGDRKDLVMKAIALLSMLDPVETEFGLSEGFLTISSKDSSALLDSHASAVSRDGGVDSSWATGRGEIRHTASGKEEIGGSALKDGNEGWWRTDGPQNSLFLGWYREARWWAGTERGDEKRSLSVVPALFRPAESLSPIPSAFNTPAIQPEPAFGSSPLTVFVSDWRIHRFQYHSDSMCGAFRTGPIDWIPSTSSLLRRGRTKGGSK